MIFTQAQIDEILDIIDFHHIFFCVGNVSSNVLSEDDKKVLKDHGVKWDQFSKELSHFQQMYYFGRLASSLKDQTLDITYNDFKKYIQRGQYNPLTSVEKLALNYLEQNTYNYITKQRDTIQLQTKATLEQLNAKDAFSELISEVTKEKISKKLSIQEAVLSLGEKSKKWNVDLGRIIETESQNAYSMGKGFALVEKYGQDNIRFYKRVYPGACKHCIRLYLTNGIGSEPRLFTYEELFLNGSNIGVKQNDWKPVLGTVHPFCRCDLEFVFLYEEWNKETRSFIIPDRYIEEAKKIKGNITVSVGDKKYTV